jgi:phosphopantothenoylcysteine decarboxylase / phosphopantothenate---cysteine ligase
MSGRPNIVIGVTGGIAAYKIPILVRDLVKAGMNVRCVMTDSASAFVTPTTLSALTGHDVVVGIFPAATSNTVGTNTWHIDLARWADLMLIAPATANTCAKLAHGFADNAVTTLGLALRCPLVLSPAMDTDMWENDLTQENMRILRETGCIILPPEEGPLASGLVGPGRMPEPSTLVRSLKDILRRTNQDFRGRKILVTAGPTREAIDPVRFIGNRSSGKMGFAVANAAARRGAEVTLITGPVNLRSPHAVRRIDVESAAQMHREVVRHYRSADAVIMTAAVADFTPVHSFPGKIRKTSTPGGRITIEMKETTDIIGQLGHSRGKRVLVGFALETDNGPANARRKLREKNLDFIVLNNPLEKGSGFETDTNRVTIISKSGDTEHLKRLPKTDVAHEILNRITRCWPVKKR